MVTFLSSLYPYRANKAKARLNKMNFSREQKDSLLVMLQHELWVVRGPKAFGLSLLLYASHCLFQNGQLIQEHVDTSYMEMLSHCCVAVPERKWSSLEKSTCSSHSKPFNIDMKPSSTRENSCLMLDDLKEKNSCVQ